MDIVKTKIEGLNGTVEVDSTPGKTKIEGLNGTVEVDSTPGAGTKITLRLPLTLAILSALLTEVGEVVYVLPLDDVEETLQVRSEQVKWIQGRRVVRVRDRIIPVVSLDEVFPDLPQELRTATLEAPMLTLVLVGAADQTVGLVVDRLLGKEDVVIKPLDENFRSVRGLAGASIMGDGRVSLILDTGVLLDGAADLSSDANVCYTALDGVALEGARHATRALSKWLGRPVRITTDGFQKVPLCELSEAVASYEEPIVAVQMGIAGDLSGHALWRRCWAHRRNRTFIRMSWHGPASRRQAIS